MFQYCAHNHFHFGGPGEWGGYPRCNESYHLNWFHIEAIKNWFQIKAIWKWFNIELSITFTSGAQGRGQATQDNLSQIIEIDFILRQLKTDFKLKQFENDSILSYQSLSLQGPKGGGRLPQIIEIDFILRQLKT